MTSKASQAEQDSKEYLHMEWDADGSLLDCMVWVGHEEDASKTIRERGFMMFRLSDDSISLYLPVVDVVGGEDA